MGDDRGTGAERAPSAREVSTLRLGAAGDPGQPLADLVATLGRALDGTGPALLPVPAGPPGDAVLRAAALDHEPVDRGTALLLPTSGSTGRPKVVELASAALLASASATHARIGPPGRWALALPLTHVAGWQVLVRGLTATEPAERLPSVVPVDHGFTAAALVAALDGDGPAVRYTSLVPTQLARALDDPTATAALVRLDALLLGGAATPEPLYRRAIRAGIHVVRTYGSTETCGGCIYDGVPLDDVEVQVDDDGRLLVTGPALGTRYRGDPALTADAFVVRDGHRWFVTSDRAEMRSGRVTVLGRADDVIVTGGEKVEPARVEAYLLELPEVRDAIVVGVPDGEWGEAVVALVAVRTDGDAGADGARLEERLREHVAGALGRHAAPRRTLVVDAIPSRGIGKPDRAAARALAERLVAGRER